jgi:predicted metal-dependent hydrolase
VGHSRIGEQSIETAVVEVRRSTRRTRTVSARREGDKIIVLVPARFTRAQERQTVAEMVSKLQRTEVRRAAPAGQSDAALLERCEYLAHRYLPDHPLPTVIRWVPPMRTRWASCTPPDGSIRVSQRLRDVPDWVLDYVLIHELAHLVEAGHGPGFWSLVRSYPRMDRAIGYLEGLSAAVGWEMTEDE